MLRVVITFSPLVFTLVLVHVRGFHLYSRQPAPFPSLSERQFVALTQLHASMPSQSTTGSRQKRVAALVEWAKDVARIQIVPQLSLEQQSGIQGLGWMTSSAIAQNALLLTVPSDVALTVECPGNGPDDASVADLLQQQPSTKKFPWFVQMAVYLYQLDRDGCRSRNKMSYRPWLDSLPRHFGTPLHWSDSDIDHLQYRYISQSVQRQRTQWKDYYEQLQQTTIPKLSWSDFCWGCECARSRAFSGAYTGSAFNPSIYAFTLLLVTVYVGAGFGTLEQAANGAGLVLCASVLKDFVLPKLIRNSNQRYVICPLIDMTNHKSVEAAGEVSFEYFGNAYSLALPYAPVSADSQVYISYGARSNDQLLQYYGFVEANNPHDVYIMPPLREWDIHALELACGRTFASGRLEKLNRAGLLGNDIECVMNDEKDEEAANVGGGVVLTRREGIDLAVLQALRALVSTDEEWHAASESIGSFAQTNSGGPANERCARLVAHTAISMELNSKATTLVQDEALLKRIFSFKGLDASPEELLAIQFRIEKKKLLLDSLEKLDTL